MDQGFCNRLITSSLPWELLQNLANHGLVMYYILHILLANHKLCYKKLFKKLLLSNQGSYYKLILIWPITGFVTKRKITVIHGLFIIKK